MRPEPPPLDPQTFYTRYAPALLRKCERLLGDRAEAEDVVHQLFVDLIHRGRTDVGLPWLFRAATNRGLNRLRDRRRQGELLAQHGEGMLHPSPARIDERLIDRRELLSLVERLDELSAEILVLHFVDGVDQGEVAELLGLSRRAVVARIAAIRARAREES